jgi:hypothetical protein
MLLMNPRIVLQRLYNKQDYGEPSDLGKLLKYLYDSCLMYSYEIDSATEKIIKNFDERRRSTFISCYYNSQSITENMLARFGGDSGIAVCFHKAKLIRRCEADTIHKTVLHSAVKYQDFSCYDTVEKLKEDIESLDFFFNKFQENSDEQEFRIILDERQLYMVPNATGDGTLFDDSYADIVKFIPIGLDSITRIAVRRQDFDDEYFMPNLCEKFGLNLSKDEQNKRLINPIVSYEAVYEDNYDK